MPSRGRWWKKVDPRDTADFAWQLKIEVVFRPEWIFQRDFKEHIAKTFCDSAHTLEKLFPSQASKLKQ